METGEKQMRFLVIAKASDYSIARGLTQTHGWTWDAAYAAVRAWRTKTIAPLNASPNQILARMQRAPVAAVDDAKEREIAEAYQLVKTGKVVW